MVRNSSDDQDQLALAGLSEHGDGQRLPWLEAGDDDEDEGGEVDTGRLVRFAVGAFALLAAGIGGAWWATHPRAPAPALLADGSIIRAPAQPYKEAPKNPGGKTYAGTGDTSYGMSQGKVAMAHLAAGEAPAPAPVPLAKPEEKPSSAPSPAATEAVATGVGVQVGAYSTQSGAEAGWTRLAARAPALAGVKHRSIEGKADIGTVWRLQAVTADAASANALCATLKAQAIACQVKH